ncbi:MAG: hypothetical protein DI538_06810 [Azospira oryzae]|nr:MAG: hypothetical protein DI538_06810 [Azospira oryzae]
MTLRKTPPIAILLLLSSAIIANAQITTTEEDGSPKTFNYKLLIEAPVLECNIVGIKKKNAAIQVVPKNSIFTLVAKKNADTVVVRFWNWTSDASLRKEYNYVDEAEQIRKYFLMSFNDFNDKSVKRYSTVPTFTAGTVVVPVKLRFSEFDFSKDVTIGPTIGARFRLSHYNNNYLNLLFGMGISSVSLDSASTSGKVKKITDRPALTPSLGVVFEFIQNVQAGIFIGKDYISNKEDVGWAYQGKTWLSIGLGITILSRQSSASQNKEGSQSEK